METRIFKTRKLAEEYIRENYPNALLKDSYIGDGGDWVAVDMPNLQWGGDLSALDIWSENEAGDIDLLGQVAWWEEGTDKYELFINSELIAEFDNHYDAREAYDKAIEDNKYEDEPKEIKLFCNNEDIS